MKDIGGIINRLALFFSVDRRGLAALPVPGGSGP